MALLPLYGAAVSRWRCCHSDARAAASMVLAVASHVAASVLLSHPSALQGGEASLTLVATDGLGFRYTRKESGQLGALVNKAMQTAG